MTKLIGRFARLNLGFVLYALGIVLTIQANIGYAPWDVFHAGFSQTLMAALRPAPAAQTSANTTFPK